jgi:hypothetical protein
MIYQDVQDSCKKQHTFCGASCSRILALVMMPNWPRPPRTALNKSASLLGEHVTISPRPVKQRVTENLLPIS